MLLLARMHTFRIARSPREVCLWCPSKNLHYSCLGRLIEKYVYVHKWICIWRISWGHQQSAIVAWNLIISYQLKYYIYISHKTVTFPPHQWSVYITDVGTTVGTQAEQRPSGERQTREERERERGFVWCAEWDRGDWEKWHLSSMVCLSPLGFVQPMCSQ